MAKDRVVPGDVVCLTAGTYTTSTNIRLTRSGTRSAPITYRAYGNGTPVIRYTGGSATGGVLQTRRGTPWAGAHDIVIDGVTIDGGNLIGGGIFVTQGAHHITIRNCTIRDTGATGIALNAADYSVVDHNRIFHAGYNQGWSSGISLWYGGDEATYGGATAWYDTARVFHNVIADNVISGVYDNSDHHSDGNGIAVDGSGSIPPALIVNNLTFENGGRGIISAANSGNVWIVNNTAYANGLDPKVGSGKAPGIMASRVSNAHFVNNIAYGRSNGATVTSAHSYVSSEATVMWSHDIGYPGSVSGLSSRVLDDPSQYRNVDPRFNAAPAIPTSASPWLAAVAPWSIGDALAVQATSPAVDAGVDPNRLPGLPNADGLPFFATDLAGRPRVQGAAIDVGAYEH